MFRDERSAFILDDVELRIGFIRIEEAAHGRRDRIVACTRDDNPVRAGGTLRGVSSCLIGRAVVANHLALIDHGFGLRSSLLRSWNSVDLQRDAPRGFGCQCGPRIERL